MECLNEVHLRGRIGSVRTTRMGDSLNAKVTLATDLAYRSSDGYVSIDTTWHSLNIWAGRKTPQDVIESLAKGDAIEIEGRIRNVRYTRADGTETYQTEILVNSLEKVEDRQ